MQACHGASQYAPANCDVAFRRRDLQIHGRPGQKSAFRFNQRTSFGDVDDGDVVPGTNPRPDDPVLVAALEPRGAASLRLCVHKDLH
jgi:hypothetical protein